MFFTFTFFRSSSCAHTPFVFFFFRFLSSNPNQSISIEYCNLFGCHVMPLSIYNHIVSRDKERERLTSTLDCLCLVLCAVEFKMMKTPLIPITYIKHTPLWRDYTGINKRQRASGSYNIVDFRILIVDEFLNSFFTLCHSL